MFKQHILIPFGIFFAVLAISSYSVHQNHLLWEKEQHMLLKDIVDSQAKAIEKRINNSLAATYFFQSVLRYSKGELPAEVFDQFAANIIASLGGITNIQLAPNGVIRNIYPLKGHEKALGHNILRDDKRRAEANEAQRSRKLTLAGPFELIQGGIAVIGRNPVFLQDDTGSESFWGFVSVLIYLDDLLDSTDLTTLADKGYQYQLSRTNPKTGEENIFAGSRDIQLTNPVAQTVNVSNSQWLLCVSRTSSSAHRLTDGLYYLLAFIFSALACYLGYILLRQPEKLKQIVAEKTAELEKLAYYDPLTGLCNRRLFNRLADHAIAHAMRGQSSVALLYLDLDHFKHVNDSMGHEAGDALLVEVANRLTSELRDSDVIARIGGDEFCVLLTEFNGVRAAATVAEKILTMLRKPITLDGRNVTTTPSIGITIAPQDAKDCTTLLKNADMAMYSAKNAGRDKFSFYKKEMDSEIQARLTMEMDLREAIKQSDFELHFQPIIDLNNKNISSVEALIRWQHPEKGTIPPNDFIPLAEEIMLIIPLGQWVIRQACLQLKQLNESLGSNLGVSVNLSFIQFKDPELVQNIADILAESGLNHDLLQVEITESAFIENVDETAETLTKLKKLGIGIAIDDFGTGYSSLSQLRHLPIDVLKIDRAFIADLDNTDGQRIVEAIIVLARKLNLRVVAEGIETRAQLAFLMKCNCYMGQGYFFSRPVPAAALKSLPDMASFLTLDEPVAS